MQILSAVGLKRFDGCSTLWESFIDVLTFVVIIYVVYITVFVQII